MIQNINNPYIDIILNNNEIIRTFYSNIKEEDLVWHRDKEVREITVIENNGWLFQFDNEIPFLINNKITIPKEKFHRILKGSGDFIIKIKTI